MEAVLCMLVYRCLYGESPSYLTEVITQTAVAINSYTGLRSADSLSHSYAHSFFHWATASSPSPYLAPGTSSQQTSNQFHPLIVLLKNKNILAHFNLLAIYLFLIFIFILFVYFYCLAHFCVSSHLRRLKY